MNLKRIIHLLGYELKRLRWLIAVAWISLALAFTPRLLGAVGYWNPEWLRSGTNIAGFGITFFGISGLFIAIWAGLFGIKLIPTRPVKKSELLIVRLGILFGVLVIPVLTLTLFSLLLHGFGGDVISRNLLFTALAIVPLWLGLALFSRFAESLKITLAGIAILGAILAIFDTPDQSGIIESWLNVVGSWLAIRYLIASWVTTILLCISFRIVKNLSTAKRMAVSFLCFILGWASIPWAEKIESSSPYHTQLSESIAWTGQSRVRPTYDGKVIDFFFERPSLDGEHFVVWNLDGGFEGEAEVKKHPTIRREHDLHRWLDRSQMASAKRHLLKSGVLYSPNEGPSRQIIDQEPERSISGYVTGPIPTRNGEAKVKPLSGRLVGAICQIEHLASSPLGTGIAFQRDDLDAELQWISPADEKKKPIAQVRLRAPLLGQFGYDFSWSSPLRNWIFHLSYPKAGVVIDGHMDHSGSSNRIGGVQEWFQNVEFRHSSSIPNYETLSLETPRLLIYRVNVRETGYRDVTMPEYTLPPESRGSSEHLSLIKGVRAPTRKPSTKFWKQRPDPNAADRAEVGAWIRMISNAWQYPGAERDLTEYAERWGDLLIENGRKGYGKRNWLEETAFLNGSDARWRKKLVAALGEVEWAPKALVKKGWAQSGRTKVTELLAEGNRDENILKLGALLKIPGIERAILEKLGTSNSPDLYEIARNYPDIGDQFDQALDRRLTYLDKKSRSQRAYPKGHRELETNDWTALLLQGRTKDLKRFLIWIRWHLDAGDYPIGNHETKRAFVRAIKLRDLHKAKKLEVEFFQWNRALRQWTLEGKGNSK